MSEGGGGCWVLKGEGGVLGTHPLVPDRPRLHGQNTNDKAPCKVNVKTAIVEINDKGTGIETGVLMKRDILRV